MIEYTMFSEKGNRTVNEDYIACVKIDEHNICFFLADGLGGHSKGEEASKLAVQTAKKIYLENYRQKNVMQQMFEGAQKKLLEEQKNRHLYHAMKTTLNILCVSSKKILIGHIGDSRTYYFSKNKLLFRTLDHSVPQVLVSMGKLSEAKIRNHPDRNRLLQVLGAEWTDTGYETAEFRRKENIAFLLCTDGFWELINETTMITTLKSSSNTEEWLLKMKKIILENGTDTMDNFSAIALKL